MPRKSKRRKDYDVIVLPSQQPKRQRPRLRARRKPIMGDRLLHTEDTIWLRA